jgi:hypothetical protein
MSRVSVGGRAQQWRRVAVALMCVLTCACGGASGKTPAASSPNTSHTTAASPSSVASQTAAPPPTTFTSKTYGYTLNLPPLWTATEAQKAWDGKAGLSSDSAEVDQLIGTYNATAWALARRSNLKLEAYTAAMIATNARDHGDTCPAKPESKHRITIGGGAGTLLAYNCGILINLAAAVHHGVGYQFGFRDPTVQAATDPADRATFLAILGSVHFPD